MATQKGEGGSNKAPAFLQYTAPGRVRGHTFITGPLLPGQLPENETLMCVHCQMHWIIQPGSGINRGFCMMCNGPTCGKQDCESKCEPFERKLEIEERAARNAEVLSW